MKIVITGSLGNISKLIAKALIAQEHAVTVISSNSQKQQEIEALGAKAAIGSLENVDFLTSAFKDADAVYCMIPPNFAELNQVEYYKRIGNNYLHGIQQSGVKCAVHLSSWGAHLDKGTGIILGSHNVENILNSLQDVSITHIRPGSYYYNLLGFINMIKSTGFIGANYGGDDKVVWAHPIDISEAVAEELQKTAAEKRTVRYVASDERTARETARILGNVIGKPDLQWLTFTDEQARNGMEQSGIPASIVADLVDLNASIHSGAMGEHYELNKPAMGKIKVEDFAQEFAIAYSHE